MDGTSASGNVFTAALTRWDPSLAARAQCFAHLGVHRLWPYCHAVKKVDDEAVAWENFLNLSELVDATWFPSIWRTRDRQGIIDLLRLGSRSQIRAFRDRSDNHPQRAFEPVSLGHLASKGGKAE